MSGIFIIPTSIENHALAIDLQRLSFVEDQQRGTFESNAMLHKCANPACPKLFQKLGDGKLFQVESEYRRPPFSGGAAARRGRMARHVEHLLAV